MIGNPTIRVLIFLLLFFEREEEKNLIRKQFEDLEQKVMQHSQILGKTRP